MKIKNILSAFFLAGFSLIVSSCSEDFFKTMPTESVSDETALSTTDNAYAVLNGIAKTMTTQQAFFGSGFCGENHVMIKMEEYPAENYNYNYYASGWAPLFNQTFNTASNRIYCSYAWAYYYNLIGQANMVIARIDAASGSAEEKNFIKASALTFRSFAFEKLIRYYCHRWKDSNNGADPGLVLKLDDSTNSFPLSTLLETYNQIYQDLDKAIELFGNAKDMRGSDVWIPNVNVAHAVYARAALSREDYKTALEHATAAKDGYPLMSNDAYVSGFCKPTSEWIMGSFGSAEENNWYWSYGTQYSCNGYYANESDCGAGTIGHELITRIPNEDIRKKLFLTEDKFPAYDFSYNSEDVDNYFRTFGIIGITNEKMWEDVDAYISSMTPDGLDRAYSSGTFYLDGQLKFWVTDLPGVSYLPFIRTSEMVLIEAECHYFLGDEVAAQASLEELNKKSGRNPNYSCTKTGDDLFNEIKDYRALELWGEGFEWSDLKRWNLPAVRKSFEEGGNTHVSVAITIKPTDGNNWTWKIPDAETDYNDYLKVAAEK